MTRHATEDGSIIAEFEESKISIEVFQNGTIVILAPNDAGGLDVIETTLEEIIKKHLN